MNLRSILADFFEKHGRTIQTEESSFRGLLAPKDGKTPTFQKLCAEELGTARQGDWILLTSAESSPLCPGSRLETNDAEYAVRSAGCYHLGDTPLYRWAVLQQTNKEVG